MQYMTRGFPKRKQKSGEQQLLKLLMKFQGANLPSLSREVSPPSKTPLFEGEVAEKGQRMMPKLKSRPRYNWIKDRYCANRDKEGLTSLEDPRQSV